MAIIPLMKNNTNPEIQTLSDSIDNAVYCGLLDLDSDPGQAWNATFGSDFSLVDDVEIDPHPLSGELV